MLCYMTLILKRSKLVKNIFSCYIFTFRIGECDSCIIYDPEIPAVSWMNTEGDLLVLLSPEQMPNSHVHLCQPEPFHMFSSTWTRYTGDHDISEKTKAEVTRLPRINRNANDLLAKSKIVIKSRNFLHLNFQLFSCTCFKSWDLSNYRKEDQKKE